MHTFLVFAKSVLNDAVFIILLILDILGGAMAYWQVLTIPSWVLALLPTVGIGAASYRHFLRKHAVVLVHLGEPDKITVYSINGSTSDNCLLAVGMQGYLRHYGHQQALLHRLNTTDFSINSLADEYLLERLNIVHRFSDLMCQEPSDLLQYFRNGRGANSIKIPFILNPNSIYPFKFFLFLHINGDVEKTLAWLKDACFSFTYTVVDGNGERVQAMPVKIPLQLSQVSSRTGVIFD